MNEIDAAAPPSGGGMLARMVLLAQLSERIGRREPRRVLLDRILRQMMLFSRMTERLGVAAPTSTLMRAVLREAELGCLECANWRRCRQWLGGNLPDDDYHDFCPNEGLLGVLPRQANVNRPYAPE